MVALAPVLFTASATELKTGKPSTVVPPFLGVTPPTTLVPYSRHFWEWNRPALPVMPWVMSLVSLPMRIAILLAFHGQSRLLRAVLEVLGARQVEAAAFDEGLALLHIGALQADHQGHLQVDGLHGPDDAAGDAVAGHDAAEDVDQDGLHVLVAGDDAESLGDGFLGSGAAHVQEV